MTEKFNNVYNQMLNEIKETFKFTKSIIDDYDEDEDFFYTFLNNSLLLLDDISKSDSIELCNKHYYLINGIKFKEIWDDSNSNKNTNEVIWKYLHSLLFLVCNDELEEYVKDKFSKHKKFDLMLENSKLFAKYIDNMKEERETESDKDNLESSAIGDLAKEIIDELGIDENSDKQPSMADLGNMMTTTFSKINSKISSGEFNHEQLMQEAQKMMGGMDLFGGNNSHNNTKKTPRGMAGMPKNMNVPNRKVVRKNKKMNKKKSLKKIPTTPTTEITPTTETKPTTDTSPTTETIPVDITEIESFE